MSSSVLQRDPYALQCLPLHLGAALQLGRKSDLFMLGHRLTEEHPDQVGGTAWWTKSAAISRRAG